MKTLSFCAEEKKKSMSESLWPKTFEYWQVFFEMLHRSATKAETVMWPTKRKRHKTNIN